MSAVTAAITRADVVCIEDYNKGVCTEAVCQGVIRAAAAAGKPVFVDPAKLSDYAKYRGATVITPNRTEAEFSTGMRTHSAGSEDQNATLAHGLMERLDLEAVVLTLDRHGALLVERDARSAVAIPTVARAVYDVTGAGDMFLAGLAAARANGLGWVESVRFANAAAGLEVEVFGVEPIPLERIHHSILEMAAKDTGKLRTAEQLLVEIKARRSAGQRVVFTNGCFDILHSGHVTLLEKAAACGDFLVVAINSDDSVRKLKGDGRPVNGEEERARVLGGLKSVGAVVVFGEETPIKLIEAVRPEVLVKGADYRKDQVVGGAFVEANGGKVVLMDLVQGKSTTGTIAKMQRRSDTATQ